MSNSTYCLVFEGKTLPGQNLADVKKRLQKVFNKDAVTINKMFSGKKIKIKQGLDEEQARQYQAKMKSIGVLCEIVAQTPKNRPAPPVQSRTPAEAVSAPSDTKKSSPRPDVAVVGSPIVANVSQSVSADPSKALKLADIDKAFSGMIQTVDVPATYKAGVIAMGVTMVLLPLIYLGLVATVGYGVISHMVSNTTWLQTLGTKFGAIAYATPVVAGLTVILFMIKPVFAKPATKSKTVTLDPIKEPLLFHFVNKIALAVGAPRPKQIVVDCEVNASASFRKGLFSFFGDDLVLTLGMPLLAGFNTRQLAGVLAHEFGHFSQGVGMRFHYLAYKINSWFFYSVYGRDSWDVKLDRLASENENWVGIILNIARGGVWVTRKLLYGFMMTGHAVSSYMLRQMEFDADRYEAQVAGSEQFKNTCLQLQRLGAAYHVSHNYLAQAWEDKKLVNDFPSLVAHNAAQLPAQLDKALLSQMEESRTQIYDSHPSDKERMENASRQQAKGIFSLARSGRELFKHFDSISKQVSQIYYADELGLDFDPSKLVDINQVVKIAQDNEKQQEAYHTYFKDMAPVFDMPLSVNIFDTSKTDWDDLLAQYKDTETQLVEQISNRRMLMKKAEESSAKHQIFTTIFDLDQAGFILFPEWFDINAETLEAHKKHMAMYEQAWKQTMEQLRPMFEVNDRRLSIALTLLNHPIVLEADSDHAHHLKIRNRFSLLINNFKRNAQTIVEYRHRFLRLGSLLSCVPGIGQKPADYPTLRGQLLEDLKQSQQELAAALHRLDYPYVADGEHQTVAEYLDPLLPKSSQFSNEWEFYIASGNVILEKLDAIYGRIISGLANVALTVDRLIPVIEGKEPMPAKKVVQSVITPVVEPPAEPTVEPQAEQIEETAVDEAEEQQVEMAKAVGAEDFSNSNKSMFNTEIPAKIVEEKADQSAVSESETAKQPVKFTAKDKFEGTRSSFAIDESEPEAVDSHSEVEKAEVPDTTEKKVAEPEEEKNTFVVKEDKSSGARSSFAIDATEPSSEGSGSEASKADETVVEKVAAVEEHKTQTNTGAGLALVDEPASTTGHTRTQEQKPEATVDQKSAVASKEDRYAGTRSSFAIDESEPEPVENKLGAKNAEDMAEQKPALAAQQDKSVGTLSSFSIDKSESEPAESKQAETNAVDTIEQKPAFAVQENHNTGTPLSFAVDKSRPESAQSQSKESTLASESATMKSQDAAEEPAAMKSSNPFLSRSAFGQKLEQDKSTVAKSGDSNENSVANKPQPETDMPKTVNPFLANISTYKAKMANSQNEKSNGGSATISMDALNPGSMPASMTATKPDNNEKNDQSNSTKQDKLSAFSTGGLSLEPMTQEDTAETKAEKEIQSELRPADPQSVVVENPDTLIPTDNRQNGLPEDGAQQFFKSPGLPNTSKESDESHTGSSLEPAKPFKATAFSSADSTDLESRDDSASSQGDQQKDAESKSTDTRLSTHRPPSH